MSIVRALAAVAVAAFAFAPHDSPPAAAQDSSIEPFFDRPGSDFRNFELSKPDPRACQRACLDAAECKAWTYVKEGVQGRRPRCRLKSEVPDFVIDNCCVSGRVTGRRVPVDHGRAIAEYNDAIRRDPTKGALYTDRAWHYEMMDRNAESIAD